MDRPSSLLARSSKVLPGVIVLLVVVGIGALIVVPEALGLRQVVQTGGGGSSWSDLALVDSLEGRQVSAGDEIVFPRPDHPETLITRRVVVVTDHLGGPTIWTREGAATPPDPWVVRPEQVVGRVRYTVPYIGSLSQKLHTNTGIAVILAIPALAVLYELAKLAASRRGEQQRRALAAYESRLRDVSLG